MMLSIWKRAFFVSLLCGILVLLNCNAQHAHEETEATSEVETTSSPWEAITLWNLNNGNYSMDFCTEESLEGMLFEIIPVTSDSEEEIHEAMEKASELVNTFSSKKVERVVIEDGTVITTLNTSSSSTLPEPLYRVEFPTSDDTSKCVKATLMVPTSQDYLFFTEHPKEEVSLKVFNAAKEQVEASSCISGCVSETKASNSSASVNWLSPILASLVICLTSLVGVLLLSFDKGKVEVIIEYMTSFAVGCLLGVVVFHLYPEGSEYLSDMEGWVTGVCVLVGIMLSLGIEQGIHLVLSLHGVDPCSHSHQHQHTHHPHDHLHVTISAETHERVFTPVTTSPNHTHHGELQDPLPLRDSDTCSSHNGNFLQSHEETGKKHQTFFEKYIKSLKFVQPVAWMTAIGDIIHAFTDGVVLAIAFKSCNTTVGWSVALGIVLHEVPHRVGDFFIFLKAGMCLLQAIVLNLIASMASLLGVVILLAAGSVSDHTLGILLSIGTGTLLFIALSELLPPMMEVRKVKSALLHFFFVSLGCVVIGLSLLHEKHCDAETGTVGGHNH